MFKDPRFRQELRLMLAVWFGAAGGVAVLMAALTTPPARPFVAAGLALAAAVGAAILRRRAVRAARRNLTRAARAGYSG